MPTIGLTGGIASGKSAALSEFERLGASVLDADLISRELVAPGQSALQAIADRFGPDVLLPSGALDRGRLRQRVFADPAERLALEAILHPLIRGELRRRAKAVMSGYLVIAIPLLVESGHYDWIQRVLVVDVPVELQLERIIRRDGVDLEQARATVKAQTSRESRLLRASDVIINDGPLSSLHAATARLHHRYSAMQAWALTA